MKTEQQIRDEIQITDNAIEKYRNAYKKGKMPQEVFKSQIMDFLATKDALRWVIDENDRYD